MSLFRLGVLLLTTASVVSTSLPAQTIAGFPRRLVTPEAVFRAIRLAYPDQAVTGYPLEGPTLIVGGQTFSWASGRILPFERRRDWSQFAAHSFYEYSEQPPDVSQWSPERLQFAEARLAERLEANLKRDPSFFDALWGIHNRATADAAQRKVRFLGMTVSVHRGIVAALGRVQARLTSAQKTDASLARFLKGLARLEGYNWRDIAGTQSRSNHAYGTAIDVIPKSYGGKTPYWLWASDDDAGWYREAWQRRWEPHPALVKAFEAEGFVWGGKWLLFDTIHFEYRPDILVLNGLR